MSLPLVSIVMPTYQQSRYLLTSVLSVMAQTYPNTELIIVPVKDEMETEERICDILDMFPQVVTVESDIASIVHQMNLGLKEAKGEYVTVFASDDFMLPGKLMQEVQLAIHKNAVLVYGPFFFADENLAITGTSKTPPFAYETLIRRCYIPDQSLVAKSVFDEFGSWDESLEILAVYDKWLHIAERFPNSIEYNASPTWIYRKHGEQEHDARIDRQQQTHFELYKRVVTASMQRKGLPVPKDLEFRVTDV